MDMMPFGPYRPDVSDFLGQHTTYLVNAVPRGDGYGPVDSLTGYSAALPNKCRGKFYARKNDGSILVFAGTSDRLFTLDNTTQKWTPASKVAAVTSISFASPAVVTYTSHPFAVNDPVQFTTTGALPAGLSVGTTYYVISEGLTANTFEVSATLGGAAINTTDAGSGTHSVTGTYGALSSNAQWEFAQFNQYVLATHANENVQVYDLTTGGQFTDLGGTPPQAAHIAIVNRFVVLSGLAAPNVYRVQWSDLDGITTWDGTGLSDYQDMADGGAVKRVIGGKYGVIIQDQMVRSMIFAPGSPYVFGIDKIASDAAFGGFGSYSAFSAGDRVFYSTPSGFMEIIPGGYPKPIGKEQVDRTFLADVDSDQLQLFIGAADPRNTRVYWAYKSLGGNTGEFDKVLVYDWALERWGQITISGQYLSSLAQPGLTLEGVDTAYGSNLDDLPLDSLDDISVAAYTQLSAVDTVNKMGFFTGSHLEAYMQTAEISVEMNRVFARGFWPVGDASTVYGSYTHRESQKDSYSVTAEQAATSRGYVGLRKSTRFLRHRIRIPAGTAWEKMSGVFPDYTLDGI